jgi:hypothetical protein
VVDVSCTDAWMNIYAISGAATIALTSAVLFALLGWSWHALTRPFRWVVHFPASIMGEAAQSFRDEIESLGRKQGVALAAGFVFAAVYFTSYLVLPQTLFEDMPPWQLFAVLAILCSVGVYGACRMLRAELRRRRLEFERDAHIATGQGLQKLLGSHNRVFHEVPNGHSTIANVVAGLNGVYAVHVVAQRPGRHNKLRLQGDRLFFAPGKHSIPVSEFIERSERLARDLKKALQFSIRVRTVLSIPGWELEQQSGDACLVVNERNLVMLRGWKHPDDHLMHEDVEKLHDLLTERCMRSNRH